MQSPAIAGCSTRKPARFAPGRRGFSAPSGKMDGISPKCRPAAQHTALLPGAWPVTNLTIRQARDNQSAATSGNLRVTVASSTRSVN